MANDTLSKMQTRIADVLEDGENVMAAQALTTRGHRAIAEFVADTDLVEALPAMQETVGVETGLIFSERRYPTGMLAIVTEERVLLFVRSVSGKPKELLEAWCRDEVCLDAIDQGNRIKSRLFFVGLPDATCVVGEAPINGNALVESDRFVQSLTRPAMAGSAV